MRTPLSIRVYLLVVGIVSIALSALVVALPHDPYIRYQSLNGTIFARARYFYERLHFDPTPIDIAFIGSSRTAHGVDPATLEADLRERGLDLHVANLSLPASGMDIRLTEALEALRSHPEIRILVVPVVEAFPRDGHQAFGDLAPANEVFTSSWIVNRKLPSSVLRLPMRQIKLFAASLLPEAFGYRRRFNPALYEGALAPDDQLPGWNARLARYPYKSREHAIALATESKQRKNEIVAPILPRSLDWIEFGVSQSSIEAILTAARKNDTQVVFLFLPFYDGYGKPLEINWLEQRGPLWVADFIKDDPSNYADAAHVSPLALPKLNAWLADRIAQDIDEGEVPSVSSSKERD